MGTVASRAEAELGAPLRQASGRVSSKTCTKCASCTISATAWNFALTPSVHQADTAAATAADLQSKTQCKPRRGMLAFAGSLRSPANE